MEKEKIDMYLMTNAKYFEPAVVPIVRDKLQNMEDDMFLSIQTIEFKDPTMLLLISLFFGSLGVDRFLLGDIGMGVLKLLTCGVCGILTVIDWFTISKKTKEFNFVQLSMIL